MGYITKAVYASANLLPSQVTDVFNQGRAFASVHLPFQGLKNVCAITTYVPIVDINKMYKTYVDIKFLNFIQDRKSFEVACG